ncbi:hypothetical protein VU10_06025, partial [Desulfobulbus sp. US1]|nr:hypothetical protein [Desulfobulbus sp. US1]
ARRFIYGPDSVISPPSSKTAPSFFKDKKHAVLTEKKEFVVQKETVPQIYRLVKTEDIFFFNGFGTFLTRKKERGRVTLTRRRDEDGYYLSAKERKNSRKVKVVRALPRYPA